MALELALREGLPLGVSAGVASFQRQMKQLLEEDLVAPDVRQRIEQLEVLHLIKDEKGTSCFIGAGLRTS